MTALRAEPAPARHPVALGRRRAITVAALPWVALAACAALWALSLGHVSPPQLGQWGLLGSLPVTWYVAFAGTALTAIALALAGDERPRLAFTGALALLVLIIHGTPALEYTLPRYTWTFKHFGVIDAINATHTARRGADIYFNWPGFFTAADWLHRVTGLSLDTMAKWSPPAFEAAATAAVLYLARSITAHARACLLAPVLYLLADWVGQDYFAPQALAFVLAIVLLGATIRLARVELGGTRGRSPAPASRLRAWIASARLSPAALPPDTGEPSSRPALLTTIALCWAAILTSHQLTPVIVGLDVAAIVVLARARGGWLVAALALSEVGWVLLALPYLHKAHYPLLSVDPFAGTSAAVQSPSVHSLGLDVRTAAVWLLYLGLFGAGCLRGLGTLRRRGGGLVALALSVVPAFVLVAQSYGGEGELRTYLFAVPFLVCLLADWIADRPWGRSRRAPALALGIVTVMAGAFLCAYYGQEEQTIVAPGDVAAMDWFYAHAPAGTTPVYLAPDSPTRTTRRYLDYPLAADASPTLLTDAAFATSLGPGAAVSYLRSLAGPTDLVITSSQARYLDYFGIAGRRRYARLIAGLRREPGLTLVYARAGAYIWEVG